MRDICARILYKTVGKSILKNRKEQAIAECNFSETPIVGMSATANWRVEYDDFLDDFINSVSNDTAMSELADITGAVFHNKS